ncbi:MAG TPA: 2-phospho-L-lactate transferase CofD family protein [Candidatus Limnocylindrales bacterium]|nr:2-phospho-L-lactate transferase CofD family protein [Candidatus Limnocylindrales bacterium]
MTANRSRPNWRWLRPGVGVKRWLLLIFAGLLLLALAGAQLLREIYRDLPPGGPTASLLDVLSLQFLDPWLRVVILAVAGAALFLVGGWGLMRVVLEPFRVSDEPLSELIYRRRWRARGPRVVAIGGGRGLSVLLRGLKEHTSNITAVVTVADDGGSSGKLRRERGIPPMGDIRDCIAALADAEPTMTELLLYRFGGNGGGKGQGGPADLGSAASGATGHDADGLSGHAFGNLLITAMTDLSNGDFEEGVRRSNRVLAVRGKVVPAAPIALTLHARYLDGTELVGQQGITRRGGIDRIWLSPPDVTPSTEALEAIAEADLIVFGPGSLYTSIMAGLLIPELRWALADAAALRVYICNVATQVGETEHYMLSDHLSALRRHDMLGLIDAVLANDNLAARAPRGYPAEPVRADIRPDDPDWPPLVLRDLVDEVKAHHHDPHKLAAEVMALLVSSEPARRPVTARS